MKSLSFEKEIINEVKLKLDFLNIKYKSKREILCDNKFQTLGVPPLRCLVYIEVHISMIYTHSITSKT